MPQYEAPGVYIEEMPAPQSIQGVSTSIAGFVGAAEKGPTSGAPVLITSFKDFRNKFGSYLKADPWGNYRFLAYAVEGFFNNGGQVAYVKRVISGSASEAELLLRDGFVTRLTADTAVDATKRTTARLASLRGIDVGTPLVFKQMIGGVEQTQTVNVLSYSGNDVTLDAALTVRYTAAGARVYIDGLYGGDDPPAPGAERLRIQAATKGAAGKIVTVAGVPTQEGPIINVLVSDFSGAGGATIPAEATVNTTLATLPLAFGAAGGPVVGATSVALDDATYPLVAEDDEIAFTAGATTEKRTISAVDAATKTISWTGGLGADFSVAGATVHRLKALRPGPGGNTVAVADATGLDGDDLVLIQSADGTTGQIVKILSKAANVLTLDPGYPVIQSFDAGAKLSKGKGNPTATTLLLNSTSNFYQDAVIEINDGATRQYHRVTAVDPTQGTLTLAAGLGGDVPAGASVRVLEFALTIDDGLATESYTGLSLLPNAPRYVMDVVNNQSNLVKIAEVMPPNLAVDPQFTFPTNDAGVAQPLTGGSDGAALTPDDYIGVDDGPGQRTGIKALAEIDAVSIIAAPGISDQSVQSELINQCELLKDRFAVLDPSPGAPLDRTPNGIFTQRSAHDSRYAAIYYPWLVIRDPLNPTLRGGTPCPPSGHVIGVYARVDSERGVFKAPANEVVRAITGLQMKINEREHGQLNMANINVIRDFRDDNRGFRIYGARCITSDNANKYIPVRRLLIFIEESLQEGLQYVVFEPNAEDLWQRVKLTVRGFLRTVWRSGALEGLKEDEAFRVYCNINQTMTEDDVANGRLIIEVWVAPVRPAEFVIVRINRLTREAAQA